MMTFFAICDVIGTVHRHQGLGRLIFVITK
jgi:hypothetical protein